MEPRRRRDARLIALTQRQIPGAATFAVLGILYWTAHSMLRPLIGTYVVSLGGTEAEASVALAAFSLIPTVLAILIGGIVDSLGTRPVLIAGGALMVIGGALLLVPSIPTVIASQVVLGLGTLCVWVSLQASVTRASDPEESRDARARRIAAFTLFVSIGQTAGPALGGSLEGVGGYALAYGCYAALSLALFVVAVVRVRRAPVPTAPIRRIPIVRPYVDGLALLRNRAVVIAVLVSFTSLAIHDIRTGWQPLLLHAAGLDQWQIGLVLSVSAVAGLAARPFFAILLRALGAPLFVAIVVIGGAITAMLVTAAPGNMPFLLGIGALNGLLVGFTQPISLILLSDETPASRLGIASGLRSMGNQAALLASPAAFGIVSAFAGLTIAFLVVGGLAAGVGALSAGLLATRRARLDPDEDAFDLAASEVLDELVEEPPDPQRRSV